MSRNILVIGDRNSLGQQVISSLAKLDHQLFVLDSQSKNLTQFPIDLTRPETLSQENLQKVQQIIFCLEKSSNASANFGNTGFSLQQLENLAKRSYLLAENNSLGLFDFSSEIPEQVQLWGSVNDVVMGGVSQSQLQAQTDRALFTGYVSTENNGGFASVRTRNYDPVLDLSEYQGIELQVIGDGKRYKFISRCEGAWDGVSYVASFDTVYDTFTTVRIPFASLRPVVRAKTYAQAGAFESNQVYSLQLMLSKFEYDGELNATFEPGEFELGITSIKAYGGMPKPSLVVINNSQNATLEKTFYGSELAYALIRNHEIVQVKSDRQFSPAVTDLVSLAIDAASSSEAIGQFWLLGI